MVQNFIWESEIPFYDAKHNPTLVLCAKNVLLVGARPTEIFDLQEFLYNLPKFLSPQELVTTRTCGDKFFEKNFI